MKTIEVFLDDKADALGVQTGSGEVAVVGLVVDLQGKVAIVGEQVAYVEVADERGRLLGGVVAVAELSVDEQTMVEHLPAHGALVLGVAPPLVASRDVGTEVPVVGLQHLREHLVDLRGHGAREETLHRQLCLVVLPLCGSVVGSLGIEPSYAEQVEHLLVHFLVAGDD